MRRSEQALFITLRSAADVSVRFNIAQILNYFRDKGCDYTDLQISNGLMYEVKETPEQIDRMIEVIQRHPMMIIHRGERESETA